MTISTAIQTDASFKDLKRKAYTTTGAKFYEENISRNRFLPSQFVMTEAIPYPPPSESTSVIQVLDIRATLDRGVNGKRGWALKANWQSSWDSGSGDKTDLLTGLVDPAIGGALYIAKVYGGSSASDARIPEGHTSDWSLDYDAGYLTFNSEDRSESGDTEADSPRVLVYRYIGETLATASPSIASHNMKRASMTGNIDGTNKDYLLPDDCNTDLLFLPKLNGADIYPGADWSQDGSNPKLLHLTGSPDPGDRMDVVYYPVS